MMMMRTGTQDSNASTHKENQLNVHRHHKEHGSDLSRNAFTSLPLLPPMTTTKSAYSTQSSSSSSSSSVSLAVAVVGTSTPNRSHFHTMSSPQPPSYDTNGVIQVLRYGETLASFFQIDEESTDEYRNLCNTIVSVQSTLEQKARAWSRLLEIRCHHQHHHTVCTSTGSSINVPVEEATTIGMDLLRLHRRATSYFTSVMASMTHHQDDTKVVVVSHLLRRDLLRIWLSYVTVQAQYCHDNQETARMTIRHIQNQSYFMNGANAGSSFLFQEAAFYITWSMVEETVPDQYAYAISILRHGIQQKATPIIDLHNALRKLQLKQQLQPQPPPNTSPKHQIESVTNHATSHSSSSSKRIRMDHALSDCAPSQDSNMSLDTETETAPTTDTNHKNRGESDSHPKDVEPTDSVQFQLKGPVVASTATTGSATKPSSEMSAFDIPALMHHTKASEHLPSFVLSTTTTEVIDQRSGTISQTKRSVPTIPANVEGNLQTITPISTAASARATDMVAATSSVKSLKAHTPSLLLSSHHKVNGTTRKPTSSSSSFKRPPLQFKTFGLGKAERIDPSQSIVESDSDEEELKHETNPNYDKKHDDKPPTKENSHKTPTKKPKISKIDLDYMWNWDPEKRLTTTTTSSPATSNSIVDEHVKPPQLYRSTALSSGPSHGVSTHGTPSVSLSSSSSSSSSSHSNNNSTATSSSSRSTHPVPMIANNTPKSSIQTPPPPPVVNSQTKATSDDRYGNDNLLSVTSVKQTSKNGPSLNQNDAIISQHEASNILSRVNSEFLPLIQESNVIRVNQEPYVKLGVIGKGGSCKVYRALSKDCAVLAIKRVKTEDLDRKAIDGYANEIALLKRLRGNPAIIQLHDSEVDMTRQVILLVMEAGEADLNHVLQRQSIGQGTGNERSLNMNFIRLTWQVRPKKLTDI